MSVARTPKNGRARRNRRRVAQDRRRETEAVQAGASRGARRATRAGEIPEGPGRRLARRIGLWTVRAGVAAALAYAVLLGVREGYEYATTSPRFEVRGLLFSPTDHVDDARLRELMALPPGTNILSLDLEAIAQRVVEDPWVARATVTRVLPDTLEVQLIEHQATAVLLADGFLLLDEDGVPFKPLEEGERGELPIVTGLDQLDLLRDPAGARARIGRALEVLAAYQDKRRPRLSEIHIDDTSAVTLYTAELGSQLRLGRGDIGAALARYDALRAALGDDGDKLAVAHLDGVSGPNEHDRVVASFFPAREAPGFVAQVQARSEQRAEQAQQERDEQQERGSGVRQSSRSSKKRSRLPEYE